jgi:hypothetical protein
MGESERWMTITYYVESHEYQTSGAPASACLQCKLSLVKSCLPEIQ